MSRRLGCLRRRPLALRPRLATGLPYVLLQLSPEVSAALIGRRTPGGHPFDRCYLTQLVDQLERLQLERLQLDRAGSTLSPAPREMSVPGVVLQLDRLQLERV